MKASDFVVGQRVADRSDRAYKGRVVNNTLYGEEMMAVEFDDGDIIKISPNQVDPINAALEAEFDEMNRLMSVAAQALGAASLLAKKHKTTIASLNYQGVDADEFMSAFRAAGWRTSSLNC